MAVFGAPVAHEDDAERAVRASLRVLETIAELRGEGLDVVFDDRDAGPGEKFADAELLGVPLRLTVGRRTLSSGEVEAQVRRGRETRSLPLEGAADAAVELWRRLP
jgi:prolyl-tRNA synthetase